MKWEPSVTFAEFTPGWRAKFRWSTMAGRSLQNLKVIELRILKV